MNEEQRIYGLIADFESADALVEAAHQAHDQGYRRMEAYTPFPVEELAEVLGVRGRRLPLIVLAGGLIGGLGGLFLQWYSSVIDYPFNVGGRPYASWPTYIPIAFELTILFAGIATVLGMLALNGLPQPYHPVFNAPNFVTASRDRFFLCIEADDPLFDVKETSDFLHRIGAHTVTLVEP
jgi:hypothetical protein